MPDLHRQLKRFVQNRRSAGEFDLRAVQQLTDSGYVLRAEAGAPARERAQSRIRMIERFR
jgi:hypothetical protein